MFFVSDIMGKAPDSYKSYLQEKIYESLAELQIPFKRVNPDEAISMEDCIEINHKLDMKMVKTLFLCNSKKTEFYLYITTADKPFKAKNFSNTRHITCFFCPCGTHGTNYWRENWSSYCIRCFNGQEKP
ncbi:hypothetical protein [Fictibacillus terranigra]|uniref:Uncharacterized protein n=1 Tax=Fictibacillus terranigra TaxID=3058424 RepID=A0ABT8EAG3_9BACL|nr:hypothetical protein [Fictibacillus sp. CENA-BCM004]MDN4074909.1 hypothetical protein [Fictibacillus sp. CENA-BCM004]